MEELERHMFLLRDRDATQHLMEVSGGLDSLIKGEGQILAQVCTLSSHQPLAPRGTPSLSALAAVSLGVCDRTRGWQC